MDREDRWRKRVERVVNRVNQAFPNPDFENWELCEELLLSVIATYEKILQFDIKTEIATLLLDKTAFYLSSKASYASSFPVYQVGIETRLKVSNLLGWESIDNSNDGILPYKNQSQPIADTDSLKLSKGILDNWNQALKSGHPAFAKEFNHTNHADNTKEDYNQSLSLYLLSLSIKEKILDKYHPSIAASLSNLAEIYQKKHKYAQAELYYHRSLIIYEKNLGRNHEDTKVVLEQLKNLQVHFK